MTVIYRNHIADTPSASSPAALPETRSAELLAKGLTRRSAARETISPRAPRCELEAGHDRHVPPSERGHAEGFLTRCPPRDEIRGVRGEGTHPTLRGARNHLSPDPPLRTRSRT